MHSAESAPGLTEFDLDYYGWRVVLAACLGVMAGFGSLFVYTFAVFVKPLGAEFGWSREAISLGFALAAVTLGLFSPLLGRWIDRFGPRRIILPCMTVFGCGIAFAGAAALRISGSSTSPALCWAWLETARPIWPIRDPFPHGFSDAWGWRWLSSWWEQAWAR